MTRPVEFQKSAASAPYGPYNAVVQRVVDGDTIDFIVDVGFNDFVCRRFRLKAAGGKGVNAWETKGRSRKRGLAAKAWVEEQLPAGTQVVIQTERDPDLYGRYFVILNLPSGADLGTRLVELGHAKYQDWA